MGQRRAVRHDEAEASLGRLRAELADVPAASRRSRVGAPSMLEYLEQWSGRISGGHQMSPEALPELYARQALRFHREDAVSGPLLREERTLRKARGEATGYGASWYFGRHRTGDDED